MSNGLPDPDSLLPPGGMAVDAVNGVLNGLNPTANGLNSSANRLNGTLTRKDSGEEGGPGGGGQQGDGGVVKANKGMILRKSAEYIRWVYYLFLKGGGWMAAGVYSISGDRPLPHFFPNQSVLTPPLF